MEVLREARRWARGASEGSPRCSPGAPGRALGAAAILAGTLATGGLAAAALGTAPEATAATRQSPRLVVSAVRNKSLGVVLESRGRALYMLEGHNKTCTGACLKVWPALVLPKGATHATAGSGVKASELGVVTRKGARQVTYEHHPLYRYVADRSSGQARGNGVKDQWGTWSAVIISKAGTSSSKPTSTTAPSSGGYGY